MATNPFDDEDGIFHVLINEEGQHSLWPTFVAVPDGWTIVHKSDTKAACLDYVEKNWTDMRPNSLIKAMNEMAASEQGPDGKISDAAEAASQSDGTSKRLH